MDSLPVEISFDGITQRINSWTDNETNKSYLFLPSSANSENVRICLPKSVELVIGGKRFLNRDILSSVSFSEEHSLNFYKNGKIIKSKNLTFMKSENLPSVHIATASGSLTKIHSDKEKKEAGKISVIKQNGDIDYNGDLDYIKGRGNATWLTPKKPYRIKLPFESSLLDMNKGVAWILLANDYDRAGLRNRIAFDLARESGIKYAVNEKFVDLYINGEYQGLYQLTEAIETGEDRTNIEDLSASTQEINHYNLKDYKKIVQDNYTFYDIPNNPSDITGGYLIEGTYPWRDVKNDSNFTTNSKKIFVVNSPKYASRNQVEYISDFIQQTSDAINSENGINPSTGRAFTEYIDLDSWVKKFLLDEIIVDVDYEGSSSFFYKYSDSQSTLLHAGPAWDYDITFGDNWAPIIPEPLNSLSPEIICAETNLFSSNSFTLSLFRTNWFRNLYKKELFYDALVKEYRDNFIPILKVLLDEKIDLYQESITASAKMNAVRWQKDEKEQFEQVEKDKKFLNDRMIFLNRVWIDGESHYEIVVSYGDENYYFQLIGDETLSDKISLDAPHLKDKQLYIQGSDNVLFDANTKPEQDMLLYVPESESDSVSLEVPSPEVSPGSIAPSIWQKNENLLYFILIVCIGVALLAVEIKTNHMDRKKHKFSNKL